MIDKMNCKYKLNLKFKEPSSAKVQIFLQNKMLISKPKLRKGLKLKRQKSKVYKIQCRIPEIVFCLAHIMKKLARPVRQMRNKLGQYYGKFKR